MKRSKNTVKPSPNQKMISSFFTTVPAISSKDKDNRQLSRAGIAVTSCTDLAVQTTVSGSPFKSNEKSLSLNSRQIRASAPHSTPPKKRKREDVKSTSSPDLIPPTPPVIRKLNSEFITSEQLSIVKGNQFRKESPLSKKGIHQNLRTGNENISSGNSAVIQTHEITVYSEEKVQKQTSQTPRIGLYDLSHLKSLENDKRSPVKSEGRNPLDSKKLMISPIKTEDDEVLKSILEHMSPQKSVSKVQPGQSSQLSLHKKNLYSASVEDDRHTLVLRDEREPSSTVDVIGCNSREDATGNNKCLNEKEPCSTSSKQKRRKSSRSPAGSDTSELKYPPLLFAPKVVKSKLKGENNLSSPIKYVSPVKQFPSTTSNPSSDRTTHCNTPVRRSPRKHSPSTTLKNENKDTVKEYLEFKGVCNETRVSSLTVLRRSPRKHASSSPRNKSPNNCHTQTSGNGFRDEFHDLQAVFEDEYDDVLSFMANVNENISNPLDLSEAQMCEVVSIVVEIPYREAILHIKGIENNRTAACRVRGCWLACPVSEGDSISLQAIHVNGEWLLDNAKGILVLHPDILISGTTVVGSLFCPRRSVLSSLFAGMDRDSPIMVIGSIVHQLFQMVLQQKKFSEADVQNLSEQLISSKECVRMLYGANMTVAQIQKELSIFVPRIVDFAGRYVELPREAQKGKTGAWLGAPAPSTGLRTPHTARGSKQGKMWNGKIVGIQDIEETLWEPKLGIKGMVDVSVEVKDTNGRRKVMPLELKTGRASFSAEHRGQVTLYTMMMARMGQDVNSGLLLYLREGEMQEVSVSRNERKDLIQLRNTLAHYLKPRVPVINEQTGKFVPLKLPEPINFKSACEKCPYATLCSVYLKQDGLQDLSEDHPMVSISSSKSQHLLSKHIDYVMHWVGLLLLEDTSKFQTSKMSHIWRFSPIEREQNKRAIVNLRLLKCGEEADGRYIHTFIREASLCDGVLASDLRETGLSSGDYILISTAKSIAIERGNIIDIDSTSVKVTSNRDLYKRYAHETFHLDSSESKTVLVFNLTNLGCLLDDTESADRLRKIIIDRAAPTFSVKVERSIIQDTLPIFNKLNKNQRNVLIKTLRADSHLLIKGLPGTGKTATMVALVQLLVRAGLSILVTSHTHSAVDNLLLRLKAAGLQFIRLGADSRIHPQLHQFSESSLSKQCKTPEDLEKVYNKQQIVGVTCLGAGHASLVQRKFDVCLVDESTQVLQPSIMRPLFSARRFVLVGDPEQLPPVVKCHQAQELGLSKSLFARLDSDEATVSLTLNYRMNQAITDLANGLTYEGKLMCGNDMVAKATLQRTSQQECETPWVSTSLSTDIDKSVVFVDTSGAPHREEKGNTINGAMPNEESSCSNHFEVSLVMDLLNAFIKSGISCDEIGVMAPYRAQVSLLTQAIKANSYLANIEVNTVDQFQGRDKQVIVYSCTRSDGISNNKPKDREILNDKRRLTVAITRAKHKLVLIGHSETLRLYAPFKRLLECLSQSNILPVHA